MNSIENDISTKEIFNNNTKISETKIKINKPIIKTNIIPVRLIKKMNKLSHSIKEKNNIRREIINLKINNNTKKRERNKISLSYLSNNKQDLIKNYICSNCNRFFSRERVYVVDLKQCGHFFCYGCLLCLFSNCPKFVNCPKCKTIFYKDDIKFDKLTTFYLQSFLPKYNLQRKINYLPNDKRLYIRSVKFKAIPALMPKSFELPEIHYPFNKFKIYISDEYYDIVSDIKYRIFKGLILSECKIDDLSKEDIEIRYNNIIITDFPFYKTFIEFEIELTRKCKIEYCLK